MVDNQHTIPSNSGNSIRIVQEVADRVASTVGQVIYGKRNEIRLVILCMLSNGHLLLEDVPGVGKTMMTKTIARCLGCSYSRIQFTPDMLPSDITGVSIFNQQSREFEYRAGPIMSQIVLADEINRATPKTQSALLEAMEERQVTVDGVTYRMNQPFMIMATQNPIEYEGTFPLPEAQLDRFLMKISLGYPKPDEELVILSSQQYQHPLESVQQVVSVQDLLAAQQAIYEVYVAEEIKQYIVSLVDGTRSHPDVYLGSSPRGSIALFRAAQVRAAMDGRAYVIPDDVKALTEVILSHRIIISPTSRLKDVSPKSVIHDVVAHTAVPGASVAY